MFIFSLPGFNLHFACILLIKKKIYKKEKKKEKRKRKKELLSFSP
jgi:hypothetical protein